jgi:hypothetical protein
VDPPLNIILTSQAMQLYKKLFLFFFKLKRVETLLSQFWRLEITQDHYLQISVPSIIGTLHEFHLVWKEMTHFISEIQYYVHFEVGRNVSY